MKPLGEAHRTPRGHPLVFSLSIWKNAFSPGVGGVYHGLSELSYQFSNLSQVKAQ